VKALRDRLGLPGINILQFAFGDDPSAPDFQPHNYVRHSVAYTGSHDNDTTVGWWSDEGGDSSTRTPEQVARERACARAYLGLGDDAAPQAVCAAMLRALYASIADVAIAPMQDLLGLGSEARMNLPGRAEGNWRWRLAPGAASEALAERLAHLATTYGRARIERSASGEKRDKKSDEKRGTKRSHTKPRRRRTQ
jgi:4-alpha-glucanotransferase